MNLQFYIDKESASGYDAPSQRSISRPELLKTWARFAASGGVYNNGYLATVVSPYFHHRTNQQVMVLDADSEGGMLAACRYLNIQGIGYCPVISSDDDKPKIIYPMGFQGYQGQQGYVNQCPPGPPGVKGVPGKTQHFWIVTDVIGGLDEIIDFMSTIPGIDQNHIKMSQIRKFVVIRAYPKYGQLPQFPSDYHTMKNPLAIEWLDAVRGHFESHEMRMLVHCLELTQSLRDGSIFVKAADPNFIV